MSEALKGRTIKGLLLEARLGSIESQILASEIIENMFADLETQMISWVPGEGKSPDRIDALVHALTALLIKPPAGFSGGKLRAKSLSDRKIGLPNTNRGSTGRTFRVR